MLTPVLVVVALLRFMDAIKVFDTIYVLTNGGPGYATEMLSSFIYKQGLRYFNIGGAAVGLMDVSAGDRRHRHRHDSPAGPDRTGRVIAVDEWAR